MKHPALKKAIQSNGISRRFGNIFAPDFLGKLGFFTGFTKKAGKLGAEPFVDSCLRIAMEEGWGASLASHCARLKANYGIEILPQSLDERFNESSEALMRYLFGQAMNLHLRQSNPMKLLEEFTEVYTEDSTNLELPAVLKTLYKGSGGGASEAGLKIDALYGLRWGTLEVRFHDSGGSDHWQGVPKMPKGSLLLRDLGYFKVGDFQTVAQAESFFLSRLMHHVNVYLDAEGKQEMDLLSHLAAMAENEIQSLKVYIGQKHLFEVRLILQKVPQAVAEHKRHKLKTDKQNKRKNLSGRRLELCCANCYITNIPEEMVADSQIMVLYSLRWIIEILFKAWKSIDGLKEKMNRMKPHRFMCMLYAHMIAALMDTKLVHFFKIESWNLFGFKISELKAFKVLKPFKGQWWKALREADPQLIELILIDIADTFMRLAGKRKYSQREQYCDFYICVKSQT
ncbi:MAG: IS4 family transposase [Lewinellaceae bacterium]|nr:IS4 family transposase [Lewinellaceae bacterium]